jgi:hypothetical protein
MKNENKIKDLQKKFLLCGLVRRSMDIKSNILFQYICNMKFVQLIKEIFFAENSGQRNSQEENEKKIKFSPKISCIVELVHRSLDI